MGKNVLIKLPKVDDKQIFIVDLEGDHNYVFHEEFPIFVATKNKEDCRKYINENYENFSPYLNIRETIEVKY